MSQIDTLLFSVILLYVQIDGVANLAGISEPQFTHLEEVDQ